MGEENKRCDCRLCKLSASIQKALESDDIKLVKETLEVIAEEWDAADFDKSYYMCILDGSWPQATEILTKSLEKSKQIDREEAENNA